MPEPHQLICPNCLKPLKTLPVGTSQCPHCAKWIRFPAWPLLIGLFASFVASLIIAQLLGLKAYAAILWIPILLVCIRFAPILIPVPFLRPTVVEGPPVKVRWRRNLTLFLSFWAGMTFYLLAYGFIMGWGAFLTGSPDPEVRETVDMWSYPLAWVNSAFIVRPDKSFVAVLGIVAANSYFYTLAVTLAFKVVHGILQRSRITELGISHRSIDEDDDDL